MFAKLNRFYFAKLQAGYDFLWDRFGIYLGVVFLLSSLPIIVATILQHDPLWALAVRIFFTISCAWYMLSSQTEVGHHLWNVQVEWNRRFIVWVSWFAIAVNMIPPYRGTDVVFIVVTPIAGGCWFVFLRKRNAPPKKEPQRVPATAGAIGAPVACLQDRG